MSIIYSGFMKRPFDFIASLILFLVFLPIIFLTAVLLYFTGHRPILFFQERIGKDEKSFRVIKFRTMAHLTDEQGNLLPDNKRMTQFGSFIRKTSLDELPQLINVIKGEMSLIGPRPLIIDYLPLYDSDQRKRHSIRPGISGWAQVKGRNSLSWTDKFKLDNYYVSNQSFFFDLKIIFLTIIQVLRFHGISQEGQATVEPFNGKN